MAQTKSQTKPKKIKHTNVLESLKDVGSSTTRSIKKDLFQEASKDFIQQLLGTRPRKVSGEISPGEAIEFKDVFSGKHKENVRLKKQVALERKLREEEKTRTEKKSNELKVQLHALIQEVQKLAASTENLAQETQIASMQAPVEPGVYHIIFFEKLLSFVQSFRKKIDDASVWLKASNGRAQKKNYWAKYKKHGSKFLLSPDHYLSRSAG